jgi:Tfp pilus assembly protein PilF
MGDYAAAADKLRDALRIHPSFAEAHINLGAQLVRLGRPAEALEEFEAARLLGVSNAALWTNIAASRLHLQDVPAAAKAIETAFAQDAAYPQANFIGGQIALRQGAVPEALARFRRAESIPGARLMVAQILARTGQVQAARREIRTYLSSGHQSYREVAEKLMRDLGN